MSPDQYLTKWALTAPAKLCETPTSHVYQVLFQGEAAKRGRSRRTSA